MYHALRAVEEPVLVGTFAERGALPSLPGTWAAHPTVTRGLTFLRRRSLLLPDEFARLEAQSKGAGFTFATATSKTMVRTGQRSLVRSMRAGLPADAAALRLNRDLIAAGYSKLKPYHARLVARQAFATSYGAASWQALHDPRVAGILPMFRYVTMDDDRVRPAHFALHNLFFKRSHPIWLRIWPPNGYNCRCFVRGVTVNQVRQYGLVNDRVPRYTTDAQGRNVKVGPDPGFRGNPSTAIATAARTGRRL